ncbi:MAG: SDR family oxidoreductase [Cytophagales bacterium]|nr:SDR family oxidoreductase [Cytophagales bacterium]MDW8383400.1 SDR family oxidoreductase [Flammeovirgaceae bacterium]
MTNIAITGATGLVGRHLIFEIIQQNLHQLENIRLFILGRNNEKHSLEQRFTDIIASEGFSYWNLDPTEYDKIFCFLENQVKYIHTHLEAHIPIVDPSELAQIKETPIDYFFHLAALPDLRNTPATEQRVMQANFLGTKRLLELLAKCQIKEFDYIGTAFVCGKTSGKILPTYLNPTQDFNNPYEKSKLLAELAVKEFSQKHNIRCRYFRPGIVCGRLLHKPLGHAHKFDVFYEIFAFLYMEKLRILKSTDRFFETPVNLNLRLVFDPESSANIVPVDYLVKVLYQVCVQNPPDDHFHLVHEKNTNFQVFLDATLEVMNISGVQQVHEIPKDVSPIERLYHSRVGAIFNPYLNSKPKIFDTSNLQIVLQKGNLKCPPLSAENIKILMRYATQKKFGMDTHKILRRVKK